MKWRPTYNLADRSAGVSAPPIFNQEPLLAIDPVLADRWGDDRDRSSPPTTLFPSAIGTFFSPSYQECADIISQPRTITGDVLALPASAPAAAGVENAKEPDNGVGMFAR